MADAADISVQREEAEARLRDANRVRYRGISRHECIDCEEPIPERRRKAIAGCTRCTSCQEDHDARHRR
tara:strand:- start:825 stop:1031 length:207 start_codon:yes stop_codon:yes gene_type:complete